MEIYNMRVDGLTNPLGFALARPRFSWKIASSGKKQTYYRLVVRSERGAEVYDSGVVSGSRQSACTSFLPKPRTRYIWRLEAGTDSEECGAAEAEFETGAGTLSGDWISPAEPTGMHPLIGKKFTVGAGVVRARLYVTGLGLFVPFLNGARIGEDHLAPGCTDYRRIRQIYTYELPVLAGENIVEILLGNGWYKGRFAGRTNIYGTKYLLLAEVELRYEDGRVRRIGTDGSWTWRESTVAADGIYDGEAQDDTYTPLSDMPVCVEAGESKESLRDRLSVSVRAHAFDGESRLLQSPRGEYILDFGQNMAGFVSLTGNFAGGEEIILDYGEVLDKAGNFYNENLRSAVQRFSVRARAGRHTYRPYFTYFGFRYVRVKGVRPEKVEWKAYCVHSDMDRGGHFTCCDRLLEGFYRNSVWGQLSNFVDIPTDCPQRDERFGWLGDAQIFAETSLLHFECSPFWRKFLRDVEVETRKFGAPPDFAPVYAEPTDPDPIRLKGSSGWADAVAVIPEQLYIATGDERLLAEEYPAAVRWVRYMRSHSEGGLFRAGTRYGDWLAGDGEGLIGKTDRVLISTAFSFRCAEIVRRMAHELGQAGEEEEMREWAVEVRRAWRAAFLQGGELSEKTQTAYVLALRFGLLDEREKPSAAASLVALLRAGGWVARTGFIGTPELLYALSDNGYAEEALRLFLCRDRGSWLYPVACGATTVWERLEGYDDLDGAKEMNSFNHYQGGALASWLYTRLCGFIRKCPGGTSILFRPILSEALPAFAGEFLCANGRFSMSCKRCGGEFAVTLSVPFGCTAEWDGKVYTKGVYCRRIPCMQAGAEARKESI